MCETQQSYLIFLSRPTAAPCLSIAQAALLPYLPTVPWQAVAQLPMHCANAAAAVTDGYGYDDAGACSVPACGRGVEGLFLHETAAGAARELTADRLLEIERRALGL